MTFKTIHTLYGLTTSSMRQPKPFSTSRCAWAERWMGIRTPRVARLAHKRRGLRSRGCALTCRPACNARGPCRSLETPIATTTANGVTTLSRTRSRCWIKADLVVKTELSEVVSYPVGASITRSPALAHPGVDHVRLATCQRNQGDALPRYSHERTTDYQENGDLLAAILDADIDRVVMMVQGTLCGWQGRPTSIRVPNGETVGELPSAADRALRILSFDSLGAPLLIPGAVSDSAVALALDLASSVSASKGAGQVGYNASLSYAAGTIGYSSQIVGCPHCCHAVG